MSEREAIVRWLRSQAIAHANAVPAGWRGVVWAVFRPRRFMQPFVSTFALSDAARAIESGAHLEQLSEMGI